MERVAGSSAELAGFFEFCLGVARAALSVGNEPAEKFNYGLPERLRLRDPASADHTLRRVRMLRALRKLRRPSLRTFCCLWLNRPGWIGLAKGTY